MQEQNIVLEQKVATRTQELHENNMMLEVQNEEIRQQQEELLAINETLERQHIEIASQKKRAENTLVTLQDTTERLNQSIKYAQNIQQVILPDAALINSFFSDHFTIYLPKDVVSGDFYWFTNLTDAIIEEQTYQRALFALADCTGHGVPGAFVTMVCNTLLYEAVEIAKIESPAEILEDLDLRIQKILRQKEGKNSDGLDISLCLFEKQAHHKVQITFAGSHISIYYFQNLEYIGDLKNGENYSITRILGDRISIGGNTRNKEKFSNQIFTQQKGQVVYFSTDGYTDQNDVNRNRLGLQNLKKMLGTFQNMELNGQKQQLLNALKQHQKEESQRDDISIVGLLL
jgi:serine phosphatase RsbU (regulator of sigma subunit)